MNEQLQLAVLALLNYSWSEIENDYENLTAQERSCITLEEFRELNQMIHNAKKAGKL